MSLKRRSALGVHAEMNLGFMDPAPHPCPRIADYVPIQDENGVLEPFLEPPPLTGEKGSGVALTNLN